MDSNKYQQVDQSFLDQFNRMQKTGALDDLEKLRAENRILDDLVNDAAQLYALRSIEAIMAFLTERILQQFIPTHLLVAFEEPRSRELRQFYYYNLKPSQGGLSAGAYTELKRRLVEAPYTALVPDLRLGAALSIELAHFEPSIMLPLCGIEGVYGLAVLGAKVVGAPYSDVEFMYIDKFARFLSIGIQNTLHHESAITDPKTGLYNHAYFLQRLEQEIAHVARRRNGAGLIMLDIDHFKNFNDTWGHLAGDEVLMALSRQLRLAVRAEDVASRFGGEEFCILSVDCDAKTLRDICERVRSEIERMRVPYKGEILAVTASLGCCCLDPDLAISPEAYIEMADKALYVSKSEGRNRSSFYRPRLLERAEALRGRGPGTA